MSRPDDNRRLSAADLQETFERTIDGGSGVGPIPIAGRTDRGVEPFSMAALAGLDDVAFITSAHRALLHRPPDEASLCHYRNALAGGTSRIIVLGEFRYGEEGRRIGVAAPGLRWRFLLHRIYRLRGIGQALRTLTAIAALPGILRELSRLGRAVADVGSTDARVRALGAGVAATEEHVRELVAITKVLVPLGDETASLPERVDTLSARIVALHEHVRAEPWTAPILELASQFDRQAQQLAMLEKAAAESASLVSDAERVSAMVASLRDRLGWQETGAALVELVGNTLSDQRNLAVRAMNASEELRAALRDQERRLSFVLHDVRRSLAPGSDAKKSIAERQADMLAPLYVAFEDRFRGSRADITQRQRVHLPVLQGAGAGTPDRPIVDVGSGRGEWLELLRHEGLHACGVDLNESMVALCHSMGLESVHADAVTYLAALESCSLGAVTGFHIIEHLPFAVLVALLDASLRALLPGGIVIFETPNPANLLVSSRWFHLDPTHHNPLPSEMVAMIAEARGFVGVSILPLHPMATRFEAQDDVLARQLDDIFHGPQDYALIARKS